MYLGGLVGVLGEGLSRGVTGVSWGISRRVRGGA